MFVVTVLFKSIFAAEIVMRLPNVTQVSVSGYFLAEKIVSYFEVKNVLQCFFVKSSEAVIDI